MRRLSLLSDFCILGANADDVGVTGLSLQPLK